MGMVEVKCSMEGGLSKLAGNGRGEGNGDFDLRLHEFTNKLVRASNTGSQTGHGLEAIRKGAMQVIVT